MNVLFTAQCNKRALTETRRVLDQFAERRGDRTWQTPITMQGLQTVYKMLRKTARKNTAVACHWIRGKDHSELMWIVGDRKCFNSQGATPTNITSRDILRSQDENDWHTAEDIRLLASLAALFHDLGKANDAFQKKLLKSSRPIADAYRHEWVSLRLFEAFVGESRDEEWLTRLSEIKPSKEPTWFKALKKDGLDSAKPKGPFNTLPPLAAVVGWLIVSHHRVPVKHGKSCDYDLPHLPIPIKADWCSINENANASDIKACWSFKYGLPTASKRWCEHVRKVAAKMLARPTISSTCRFDNPYAIHLSRLALMLADHHYSGEESRSYYGDANFPLIANTRRDGSGDPNQRLDEHLVGVERSASRLMYTLPRMAKSLPSMTNKRFRQRSKNRRFRWQDKAFDLAESLQTQSQQHGFFGINMASTGCGKTLANGRIMYGLADPQLGARFSVALGLRTLTLQTGTAYRERLDLTEEDLAVLVGGSAIRALYELQQEESELSQYGSESQEDLFSENQSVHFEGSLEDGPLNKWLNKNQDAQKLLSAPVLSCTIDHLVPATEGIRGGRQLAPMLRLMSSDLVLDEPDDFAIEDLPALTRLVHWAGMLGSRVLLSSATLPPALIQGLFQAYLAGRTIFQQNRGQPNTPVNVCCAWFDEFSRQASNHADGDDYLQHHRQFVQTRLQKLSGAAIKEQRRLARIQALPAIASKQRQDICQTLAQLFIQQAQELHEHHSQTDPKTEKCISFGLIRMANINPLVDVAQALYQSTVPDNAYIHLCVYHSQHPLLVRSAIEEQLDTLLNRTDEKAVFDHAEIRRILDNSTEQNHLFIVLATPVAEVGRDHDYDWAIVEPSSMRSIIQLAGRIRRHRNGGCEHPNLCLLDTNVRHLESNTATPAYCRPGFESEHFKLTTHHLHELLSEEQIKVIDASTRIKERDTLTPQTNLVDLEHTRLKDLMLKTADDAQHKGKPVYWWWEYPAHLCAYMQKVQPFRQDPIGRQRYSLLVNADDEIQFCRTTPGEEAVPSDNMKHEIELAENPRISAWGAVDYLESVQALAERLGIEERNCARRFGYVELSAKEQYGWKYHSALGFSKR